MGFPDYCTIENIKEHMPDIPWADTYTPILQNLIPRASRAIDRFFKWPSGVFAVDTDTVRLMSGDGSLLLSLPMPLAALPTTVRVAETGSLTAYTTWTLNTDFYCWPENALLDGEPFLRLDIDPYNGTKLLWPSFPRCIEITGKFGFSVVPPDEIVELAIIQSIRWFKRGLQGFQDTGAIVELGQMTYTKALDPEVVAMLDMTTYSRKVI